jgi:hypothetical protein
VVLVADCSQVLQLYLSRICSITLI